MSGVVLHVLPLDLDRGAQQYAYALRAALDGRSDRHLILTLFKSSGSTLDPDIRLGFNRRVARTTGFDPRVPVHLRGMLRRLQPKAVVAHGSEPLKYVVAAGWNGPLAYYKIGLSAMGPPRAIRLWLHSSLAAVPDVVVAVSEDCRREAEITFGVAPDRLRVVANGRDPSRYHPAPGKREPGPVRLVFVGHLTPTKRPHLFIDVVRRLRSDGLSVEGRMVGGGPMLDEMQRRAGPVVEVLGPRADVPDLLRASDVLVFTSEPTGEGMPGVLIEAGLSGLPVITTDVPGARDVVLDGSTGFVIPHESPEMAHPIITDLIHDPPRLDQIGQAARSWCLERFTLETSAGAWSRILDELEAS